MPPRAALLLAALLPACGPTGTDAKCVSDRDCASGQTCSYATQRCRTPSGPDAGPIPCSADSECASGLCAGGACACTRDTWASYASGALAASCASCHGWPNALDSTRTRSLAIRGKLVNDAMPPNGGLPPDVRDRLVRWIDCGLPP